MKFYIINLGIIFLNVVKGETIPPYVEEMKDEMSLSLYTRIEDKKKDYILDPLGEVLNETRRRWKRRKWPPWQYGTYSNRGQVCLYIQMSYKNAITHMRRYYNIRATYTENMEYEIGYITHEIIFKYQILLELYQLIEKRFLIHPRHNAAPTMLMLYFYSNIVEESRAIIYLCNMLHETEAKYKKRRIQRKHKNTFNDYIDPDVAKKPGRVLTKEEQYEQLMKAKEREERKQARHLAKQRKVMIKFGITPPKKVFVTKKSLFPLHYGWSIEEWE